MGNFGHVYCPLRSRSGAIGLRWEYRFMVSLEGLLFTQKPLSHNLRGFSRKFPVTPLFFFFFHSFLIRVLRNRSDELRTFHNLARNSID